MATKVEMAAEDLVYDRWRERYGDVAPHPDLVDKAIGAGPEAIDRAFEEHTEARGNVVDLMDWRDADRTASG